MEVHGRQPDELRAEALRASRDRVRNARRLLESLPLARHRAVRDARSDHPSPARETDVRHERTDVVDLSIAADRHANGAEEARAARVEELRLAHENGTLNTPELRERAAERMLRG